MRACGRASRPPMTHVLSADEKTSIQARLGRRPPALQARRPMCIEHEYQRGGAWAYLAAWDVHRAKLFGRCEPRTGIAAFERLVAQVMSQVPYRSATQVFWVLDNSSSHDGNISIKPLQRAWPAIVPAHTLIHTSRLNQIEIYFSVVQRNVLTPNDFVSLADVEERLLRFQKRYEQVARPSERGFSHHDLTALKARLEAKVAPLPVAA